MLDNRKRNKIKNNEIQGWRLELASFRYTIQYQAGKDSTVPDALTRAVYASVSSFDSAAIHDKLCHPGVTRMLHFIQSKNLSFSTEEVKQKMCSFCGICAEVTPRFLIAPEATLIKATQLMERLSTDFKGLIDSQQVYSN